MVYANYGRKVDFEYLKSQGIDIRNHIVIARYGAIFRGNIVSLLSLTLILVVQLFSSSSVNLIKRLNLPKMPAQLALFFFPTRKTLRRKVGNLFIPIAFGFREWLFNLVRFFLGTEIHSRLFIQPLVCKKVINNRVL